MARMARLKISGDEAWYHVHCRIAGRKGSYPLLNSLCQRRMTGLIKFLSKVYCCEIAAFCVMGNHYHLVIKFQMPQALKKEELLRRALLLYPRSERYIKQWSERKWEQFNARIFDLSEYMRNLQAAFARWYNGTFERRGRFWGDRFKSVLLEDYRAVTDCMLYVELNPVRAGLVERPEDWQSSSLYLRMSKLDKWLLPLSKLFSDENRDSDGGDLLREYRERLYYRGNIATQAMKKGKVLLSDEVIAGEKARGFAVSGMYGRQLRYFVDGIALGSEGFIRKQIQRLREEGRYLRRKHPVEQLVEGHMTVREQRSHAVVF
jgi:REP element-mobilizing transposase RayT